MLKKWMSLLMALIITVTIVFPAGAAATSADAQDTTEMVSENKSTEEITVPMESTESWETDCSVAPNKAAETTDAVAKESSDSADSTGSEAIAEGIKVIDAAETLEETAFVDAVAENEADKEDDVTSFDGTVDDVGEGEEYEVRSILPLQEIKAYLVLNDYSEDELKSFPIASVLEMLQDKDGNPIAIDPDAKIVWVRFKDEEGNVIRDEYHEIDRSETVDLTDFEFSTGYKMELIVGSGNQLDPNNVRYIVRTFISGNLTESFTFEFYQEDAAGNRQKVVPTKQKTVGLEMFGITETSNIFTIPTHVIGTEYYLGINSIADEHPNVRVDIYKGLDYYYGGSPITNEILNQDMTKPGAGHKTTLDLSDDQNEVLAHNIYTWVLSDKDDGYVYGTRILVVYVTNETLELSATASVYEDGIMKDVTVYRGSLAQLISMGYEGDTPTFGYAVEQLCVMLDDGYTSGTYYVTVNLDISKYGSGAAAVSHITKVVEGLYSTLEEAENAPDVKDELFPGEAATLPCGSVFDWGNDEHGAYCYYTIFFDDGVVEQFEIVLLEYSKQVVTSQMVDYFESPVVGSEDPWFRVTGASRNGTALDTYIVENGKPINMDTIYGYGYQTIFINDSSVDLANITPTIWLADSERIKLYVNGSPFNEGDSIDCSAGTVQFTAIIDGHQKNYLVTFLKKEAVPKLFVYGPDSREVFLDEYFEYKHDILIANLGDAPLTGLRVELDATNCRLDDYWTVGGEGNDTLAPFTTTSTTTQYGELDNLAKIRLLPDGDGEIEGTLTIYADGQEPVVITLTGQARNPMITTTQESFASYKAVKYVPYAYLISTNNMYDWTDVNFSLTGELPDGMEFFPETGEIYGVPQETGEFAITIEATFTSDTYTFESSTVELTLTVLENTNENVYLASDSNYEIKQAIGTQTGEYDFVLETIEDTVFTSYGELVEFVDIWLNGKRLVEGVDYEKEEGSTKITIRSQTLEDEVNGDGSENTIAMEFRTEDENTEGEGELKRTAQNFTVKSDVEKVIEQIDALPPVENITLNNKSDVQAARAAYDALSSSDQTKVTNYSKLTAAEAKIAELEANQTAANKVIKLINDLPSTIHLSDKQAVEEARAAYNALTAAQKNLVTNYDRLLRAEAAIAQLEAEQAEIEMNKAAAKVVVDLIDALPTPITLTDKDAVKAARTAYNNLTADQKGYVTNYDKLLAAEAAIAELEAAEKEKAEVNAVIALINAIPNPVTLEDKSTVEAAREAYDALSPAQKESVVNYKTLTDAEATIAALEALQEADEADRAAADTVIALIAAIPDPVTLEDKGEVEAAREAYNALTDIQKQLVSNYSDLTDAEAAIKTLEAYEAAAEEDRAAADVVIALIDALPDEVTLEDKNQVVAAREAYDDLTEDQQDIVTNYSKLTAAEVKIAVLEDNEYEETLSVTFVALFVDREGKPLSDVAIELHSVIQTGRTDGNGSIVFTDVELGEHILCTKDANGNITSQKGFTIVAGSPLSINDDVITAENGAVFTVTVQQNGSTLTFLRIEEGNTAPEAEINQGNEENGIDIGEGNATGDNSGSGGTAVKTADETHLSFWNTLMFISLAGFLIMMICSARKHGKYEKRR